MQFTVYLNTNPETKEAIPYLLDVQSSLLTDLGTRVAVPLYHASAMKGKVIKGLMPVLEVDDKKVVMVTPEMAGIPKKTLGAAITNLAGQRAEIVSAIDLLVFGL